MPALAPALRKNLETTVKDARDLVEEAARIALHRLAVDEREPFPSMSAEQCALRVTLRAKGKQLGDPLERARPNAAGRLETMPGLATECAYEHWHRLLFARFLAENGLLIHPGAGVAVTLAECEELAPDEGLPDGWAVATRYAAHMLPRIFRPDDPLLAVTLAPESRQALERKVAELPAAVFLADDSLGWVYQFWQARRKDQVNAGGEKIDGRTISAVTQLFTEHYMVAFLMHNSLGAWWAARHPGQPLPLAEGEVDYLRRLEDGSPAAGTYPAWPDRAADLRILDPCGGSGHFMVAALDLLSRMRMLEEGLSECDAVDAVLRDNLFMLEIDPRCTQIAAFALALAAWRRGGYRELPALHVACSGLPVKAESGEWARLVPPKQRFAMRALHSVFTQAPDLGSLVDPRLVADLGHQSVDFADLRDAVRGALEQEEVRTDPDQYAIGVIAQGLAEAADILAGRYHLVITNVPYLARGKQGDVLREFCNSRYFDAKADLATVFVERCRQLCAPGGASALVTPQNWLFLGSYKRLREHLLKDCAWQLVARLGEGGFESNQAAGAFTILLLLTNAAPDSGQSLTTIDAAAPRTAPEKAVLLRDGALRETSQAGQLGNPDSRIALTPNPDHSLLSKYAESIHGLTTGDLPRMSVRYWELRRCGFPWRYLQSTVDESIDYGGRSLLIRWGDNGSILNNLPGSRKDGQAAWSKQGIVISQMRSLACTLYTGDIFDVNSAAIIPREGCHLAAIYAYCRSSDYSVAVRIIDQKLNVTSATLTKVPFDLAH